MILVRPLPPDERDWVRDRVAERWGSPTVVAHGVVYEPSSLPGLVAEDEGRPVGLLTFIVEGDECEIVTIDAFEEGRGVGAALMDSVKGLNTSAFGSSRRTTTPGHSASTSASVSGSLACTMAPSSVRAS
jgi:hypothetical protein